MTHFAPSLLSQLTSVDPMLVLAVLLKGSALLLIAGFVASRLRTAAQRHLVWCLGLAAQLVLPLLAALGPALPVAIGARPEPGRIVKATERYLPPAVVGGAAYAPAGVAAEASPSTHATAPSTVLRPAQRGGWLVIAAAWAAGSLLLVLSLFHAARQRNRLLRHAAPATSARWRTLLAQSADLLGLTRLPNLLIGPHDAMPMTWGTLRPVVLLPTSAVDWPDARCHDVLLHELSHVRRRDHLSQSMAQLVRALYWPNPLVWWAVRRLRAASEQACDDRVLGAGARPSRYADYLLAAARTLRATGAAAGVAMVRTPHLAARIANILDQTRSRTPLKRRHLLIAGLATVAIVLPLAAAVPAPPITPDAPGLLPEPTATPVPSPGPVPWRAVQTPPIASAASEILPQPPVHPLTPAPEAMPGPALPAVAGETPALPAVAGETPALPAVALPAVAEPAAPSALPLPAAPAPSPQAPEAPNVVPAPDPPAPLPLLAAVPKRRFSRIYVLEEDGEPVAELTKGRWKTRAELTVGETTYELYRTGRLRGEFVLARGGSILARAKKPSALRRGYELHHGDSTYTLRRQSWARRRFILAHGERILGAIEPESWRSRRARISLSEDWPLELRVFAFWLVELSWQEDEKNAVAAAVLAAGSD